MDYEKATFKVIQDGPLEVSGSFRLKLRNGTHTETGDTIYLCRCGGSGNKPYCDGTHKKNGFSG